MSSGPRLALAPRAVGGAHDQIRIGGRFARGSERPASSADWLASQKCTRYQALRLRSRTLRVPPDTRRSQSRPIGAPAAPERRLQ